METEAAAASVSDMLEQMRTYDSELNKQELKLFHANDKAQHEAKVHAEAKELITITSRLYWRARELFDRHKPKDIRDVSAYVTVTGALGGGGYYAASIIIDKLTPLMQWFGKLMTALPPL